MWGAFSIPVSTPSPHSRGLSIYTDIKSVVMLASKVPLGKRQKGGGDGEENPEWVDYGEHMPNDICRVVYWSVQNGPLVLLRRAGGCVWITSSSINSFFLKTRSRRGNNGWPSKELEENTKTNIRQRKENDWKCRKYDYSIKTYNDGNTFVHWYLRRTSGLDLGIWRSLL